MDVSRAQMDALGYTQVLEALQQVPSVVIQHPDTGAETAPAVVSLRGPDPSEAMVTLDGQQLNDGNTGDIDLSQFAVPAFNASASARDSARPTRRAATRSAARSTSSRCARRWTIISTSPARSAPTARRRAGSTRPARSASSATRSRATTFISRARSIKSLGRSREQLADLLRSGDQDQDAELPRLHAPRVVDLARCSGSSISITTFRSARTSGFASSRSATIATSPPHSTGSRGIRRASSAVRGRRAGFRRRRARPTSSPTPSSATTSAKGAASLAQSIRAYDAYGARAARIGHAAGRLLR